MLQSQVTIKIVTEITESHRMRTESPGYQAFYGALDGSNWDGNERLRKGKLRRRPSNKIIRHKRKRD